MVTYLLLDAADIRNGWAGKKPGWAMGSFVPVDDQDSAANSK
jgi:hypothetical protein